MKLDWAILANHGEVQNNVVYIAGGGIDTINAQSVPVYFTGSVISRFEIHPTEIGRPHDVEVRVVNEDGQLIAQINGQAAVQKSEDLPTGWQYHSIIAINFGGMPLPKEGFYSVEILADGLHQKSLPFRVRLLKL